MGRKIKFPFKFSLSLIILLFYSSCCNTTEPPDPPPPPPPVVEEPIITLELDDAHCTEAWLKLTTKDLELPAELTLKQYNPTGDSVSQIFILNTQDSLLYIDSLLPNQNYSFQIFSNEHQVSSIKQRVTTMDTTSHNFTFETVTFGGETGSSVLYDVAIIDENNIWAVGDIWIKDDTSSLGYTKYNAVHWDGSQWVLKEILYGGFAVPITSVWAFSENDIWFGIGYLIHWNGLIFREITIPDWNTRINKIWGKSSNDLYIVGYAGNIAHYNGVSWTKIESGTTLNINDIWGDFNEKTQEWEILAVAGNILQGTENQIIKISNNNSSYLDNTGSSWPLRSLWFEAERNYYVAGSGIYQKHSLTVSIWLNDIYSITTYSINRIRASAINDIIATGGAGEVIHFNGYSWISYIENTQLASGNYYGCSIKGNKIIAVGQNNPMAVITIGSR